MVRLSLYSLPIGLMLAQIKESLAGAEPEEEQPGAMWIHS